MNFRSNMESLRLLVLEYYRNNISYSEYRDTRSKLLSLIDQELNGVKILDDVDKNEVNTSLLNKALSLLKNNKLKEFN